MSTKLQNLYNAEKNSVILDRIDGIERAAKTVLSGVDEGDGLISLPQRGRWLANSI